MRLLLVRHAEAVDYGTGGVSDADRPLTARGVATAAKLADTLRGKLSLDAVVCSPYLRARQTAEPLLALAPAGCQLVICPDLVPSGNDPHAVAAVLSELKGRTVAVVGHLPHMAHFAAWLIGGGAVEFDRGTAALVQTDAGAGEASGALRWLLSPDWYE